MSDVMRNGSYIEGSVASLSPATYSVSPATYSVSPATYSVSPATLNSFSSNVNYFLHYSQKKLITDFFGIFSR